MINKLLKQLHSVFYLYDWLKPIVCRYFGHKILVSYMVYQQEKIIKNYDKTKIKKTIHSYDPYFVYSCARCGKKLGTKRLKRKLTKKEATEYSNQTIKDIQHLKQLNKS